ncbi:hypothetical protein [Rubritalea sp.]|uniref:hypothetical protein n=1 Tax=Rubritalea sp. TaxID=2109375 RepID=UPI003EF1178B
MQDNEQRVLVSFEVAVDTYPPVTPDGTLILATKFFPAQLPEVYIPRAHLLERNRGVTPPITLVSAPAGYGKSSLISEWVTTQKLPFAWLSFDSYDDSLRGVLAYLVAAVESVRPNACQQTHSLLVALNCHQ